MRCCMLIAVLVPEATAFLQNIYAAYYLNNSIAVNNYLLHKALPLKGATQQLLNSIAMLVTKIVKPAFKRCATAVASHPCAAYY